MTATRRVIHPALFRLVVAAAVAVGLAIPLAALSSSSADAAVSASVGMHAVKVAATRKGAKYRHGSQGPKAFDCSGLTRWSYKKVGKNLPRTAQGQWKATLHIRKAVPARRRPGLLLPRQARLPRGHLRRPRQDLARPAARQAGQEGPAVDVARAVRPGALTPRVLRAGQ